MGWKEDRDARRARKGKLGKKYPTSSNPITNPPLPNNETMVKRQSLLVNMKKIKVSKETI